MFDSFYYLLDLNNTWLPQPRFILSQQTNLNWDSILALGLPLGLVVKRTHMPSSHPFWQHFISFNAK